MIAAAGIDSDIKEFIRLGGSIDEFRVFDDKADKYSVDFQYLLMNRWAFDRIIRTPGEVVHDFASKIELVAFLHLQIFGIEVQPAFFQMAPRRAVNLGGAPLQFADFFRIGLLH